MNVDEFYRQMSYIKDNCNILSMDEIVDIKRKDEMWPENAVAVTFDDGFKNNYECAAPILNELNIPATFYICSGMIDSKKMFWVDKIEDCINRTKKNAIEIVLDIPLTLSLKSKEEKIQALTKIKSFCKSADIKIKERVLKDLELITGIQPKASSALNYQMMSWDELKSLNNNQLFTIGGHTLYHDIMSAHVDDENMFKDIELSIGLLEFNLNKNNTFFIS